MRRRSIALGALALTLCGGVSHAAAGREKPKLLLVTNHRDAAIIPLLRSELESLELAVETVESKDTEVLPRDLETAGRAHDAVATIRVLVSSGRVEIWIADRITGKVVLRDVLAQEAGSKISESTIVLRVVELLRASLMEADAPHPPRGEIKPPPKLFPVVGYPDASSRLHLQAGPALLASVGGVGPIPMVEFDVGYRFSDHFSAAGSGAVAFLPGQVHAVEGTAKLHVRLASAGLMVHTRRSACPWQPFVRASVGVLSLDARGIAGSPYVGYQRDALGLAVLAGFGTRLYLGRNVAFAATVQALRALEPLAMDFNQATVAHFGQFAMLFGVGLVLLVP
jgi:hypothetical protein